MELKLIQVSEGTFEDFYPTWKNGIMYFASKCTGTNDTLTYLK